MNNVERMIAGLRCCTESKNVCVADECPLFEMCQADKVNPMGVAAEMLAALVQQRDAAVEDMRAICAAFEACWCCKYKNEDDELSNDCMDCKKACNWEWRGVQEVAEDDVKKAQIPVWISVKDKLPENDSHYLVFASDTCEVVECIYYGDGEWMTKDLENMTDCVTHWMQLPKHPKEGALNGV